MPKQSFQITGLAGEKTLSGTISIQGAKNSALKAMAAAILFDGPVTLENIPETSDTQTMTEVLTRLGAQVKWVQDGDLSMILNIDSTSITSTDIDPTLAGSMRASVVLTGPLLARYGKVSFPTPGGCVIGARPIDLFIDGYKKMGAEIDEDKNSYYITAPDNDGSKLHETEIFFNKQTVESLSLAIECFNQTSFNVKIIKANAKRFTKEVFKRQLQRSLVRINSSWRRGNSSLASIKS